MFYLIPAPVHRVALRAAHRVRLVWWRLRKPDLIGCRVIARDAQGRVLLVRHAYGSGNWMLPGGGLRRGEDPLIAALRELAEETGSDLEQPRLLTIVETPLAGTVNRTWVIAGTISAAPRPDGREIIAADCFAKDSLPEPMTPRFRFQLGQWLEMLDSERQAGLDGTG